MVVKHEKKSRKKLGYNHHNGLRRRGSGNRGGFGRAGQGKRCKQKKHKFMIDGKLSYGKHGFTSKKKEIPSINVGELAAMIGGMKKGSDGRYHINLKGMKILGRGSISSPVVIADCYGVSESARMKIEKAGGELAEK